MKKRPLILKKKVAENGPDKFAEKSRSGLATVAAVFTGGVDVGQLHRYSGMQAC